MCFLIDEQCHLNGSKYATQGIKKVIDDHQKDSIERAHHVKSRTMAHKFDDETLTEMHERGATYEQDLMDNKKFEQVKKRRSNVQYVSEAKNSSARGDYSDDGL